MSTKEDRWTEQKHIPLRFRSILLSMQDNRESNDDTDEKIYAEYRAVLLRYSEEASANLDKNLIALAGGALALSITFINQIAPNPVKFWVCAVAWGLLALALTSTLISFFLSNLAMKRQMQILDDGATKGVLEFKGPNTFNCLTNAANWVSIIAFFLGVAALVTFVSINALQPDEPQPWYSFLSIGGINGRR